MNKLIKKLIKTPKINNMNLVGIGKMERENIDLNYKIKQLF